MSTIPQRQLVVRIHRRLFNAFGSHEPTRAVTIWVRWRMKRRVRGVSIAVSDARCRS